MARVTMEKVAALLADAPMSALEMATLLYKKRPTHKEIANIHRSVYRLRHDKDAIIRCSSKTGKYTMTGFNFTKHVRYTPLSTLILDLLAMQPLSPDTLVRLVYKVEPSTSRRASISKLISRLRTEKKISIVYDSYIGKYVLNRICVLNGDGHAEITDGRIT